MSKTRHSTAVEIRKIRSLSIRYSAGHEIRDHKHDWGQLVYASSGVITVTAQKNRWLVPARRAVWIPPYELHRIKMHCSTFLQTIYINADLTASGLNTSAAVNVSPLLHELIIHLCARGIVTGDTAESRNLIEFVTFQLQALKTAALNLPMPEDDRAVTLAKYLLDSPDTQLQLDHLAKNSGASIRTMQRIFQAETGMSLSHWRNRARMLHALQLLGQNESVTSVSMALGYDSMSAFIFSFRKFFGVTPGKYFAEF